MSRLRSLRVRLAIVYAALAFDVSTNGHLLNDGVGEAEASDHIDDLDHDGEPDA